MTGLEELSRRLYRQLDSTGFSHRMISIRRNFYRCLGRLCSANDGQKVLVSGSKAEGMTKLLQSDADILYFWKNTICIDDPGLENLISAHMTVFTILNTQTGYCMLELLRHGTIQYVGITNCLVPFNGKVMLSSQLLVQEDIDNATPQDGETITKTGPARTSTLPYAAIFDSVTTFSCVCRSIIKDWTNRPRPNDWPSSPLRQSVLQMTGNLVATGPDDSETKHLEWRYCFNEIELLILETLNDTQLKLYKMLKTINTDIFKQRGLSLTSFIMKNVVFWLAETHPQSQFLPETLFYWVCEALILLKHYVETNNIPYYMIPGRNLLKEKVKESDRPKLTEVIINVLQRGPILLFMCKTFRKYVDLKPSELNVIKQKMEVLELCNLYMYYHMLKCQGRDLNQDVLYTLLQGRIQQILDSDWPSSIQQQLSRGGNLLEICQFFLG